MSLWSRAAEVARQTPESRNRLVDFLRAASILAVISGHWLLAAPWVAGGELTLGNMLELTEFTKWLSWAFQVMPVFFLVGGYANAVSWQSALRDGKPYSAWLDSRLRRLLLPVLALIGVWIVFAIAARAIGIDPALVEAGSKIALIPVWFLAIYTIVILFVPLSHAAWRRWGFWSFLAPAVLAVIDDALFFRGLTGLGWFNYLFIWLAVHQLGYAWRDGRLPSSLARLACGCGGLAAGGRCAARLCRSGAARGLRPRRHGTARPADRGRADAVCGRRGRWPAASPAPALRSGALVAGRGIRGDEPRPIRVRFGVHAAGEIEQFDAAELDRVTLALNRDVAASERLAVAQLRRIVP